MNWQPIETAPKDGTEILLTWNGKMYLGHFADVERRNHGEVVFRKQYWYLADFMSFGGDPKPTHWMVIPSPPLDNPSQITPDVAGS